MEKPFIFLFFLFAFFSCQEEAPVVIRNEADLKQLITHDYLKISYHTDDLSLKKCSDLSFGFDDIEVIKISQSNFEDILTGLEKAKLSPSQTNNEVDFKVEYNGRTYCLNHLGQLYRNNRKLVDDPQLVYLIKSKSNYYNYFDQEELEKNDTLISKFGTPSNYSAHVPEISGTWLDNDSLKVEQGFVQTKHHIILTY